LEPVADSGSKRDGQHGAGAEAAGGVDPPAVAEEAEPAAGAGAPASWPLCPAGDRATQLHIADFAADIARRGRSADTPTAADQLTHGFGLEEDEPAACPRTVRLPGQCRPAAEEEAVLRRSRTCTGGDRGAQPDTGVQAG